MYEEIFKALAKKNIRYMVVGGVAVVLHGFLRATADLDLMVAFDHDNINAFIGVIKARGYKPKPPVPIDDFSSPDNRAKWKRDKGMLVFSLYHPKRPQDLIDVFVDEPIPFDEAYAGRKLISTGKTTISVISIPDLIRLKRMSGREQDMEDIRAMSALQSGGGHES